MGEGSAPAGTGGDRGGPRRPGGSTPEDGSRVAVGMDSGGTHTRLVALTAGGEPLLRREGPGAAVDPRAPRASARRLAEMVRELAREGRITVPVGSLCVGVAGAHREPPRRALEAALEEAGVARRLTVLSDAEVALHDAHGDGPGLLLVAGTGSVAWGRDGSGRTARAGGWGPLLGDEGSGHAIARAALQRITRSADGRAPPTALSGRILDHLDLSGEGELVDWIAGRDRARVAALAPRVVEAAEDGVDPAVEIVGRAVEELAGAVEAVRRRLGPWPDTPELALAGGLLAPGGSLRGRMIEALESRPVRIREAPVDPARGAAAMALREIEPPRPGGASPG